MWNNKKVIVVAAVFGVLILVGATAGVVFAQSNIKGSAMVEKPAAAANNQTSQLARVAKILGIAQDKVESAFKQAEQEIANERLDAQLKQLIDAGKITAEQAKQYKDWLKAEPTISTELKDKYDQWLKSKPNVPLPGRGGLGDRLPGFGLPRFGGR